MTNDKQQQQKTKQKQINDNETRKTIDNKLKITFKE